MPFLYLNSDMMGTGAPALGRKLLGMYLDELARSDVRVDLVGWAQNHGVAEIAVPRRIVHTGEIPVLGTGKTDYVKVEKIILAET